MLFCTSSFLPNADTSAWTDWTAWSGCLEENQKTQNRTRTCTAPITHPASEQITTKSALPCAGVGIEIKPCTTICPPSTEASENGKMPRLLLTAFRQGWHPAFLTILSTFRMEKCRLWFKRGEKREKGKEKERKRRKWREQESNLQWQRLASPPRCQSLRPLSWLKKNRLRDD